MFNLIEVYMKYLTRFKTEEEYNQARPQIDKLEYNVSWIEMANENNVRYGGTREPSITTHQCSFICDDNNSNPIIPISGDTSWIKGRRCLVKKTDSGVAICYLDDNNSELFHDGSSEDCPFEQHPHAPRLSCRCLRLSGLG
jgi:hypothetical protein